MRTRLSLTIGLALIAALTTTAAAQSATYLTLGTNNTSNASTGLSGSAATELNVSTSSTAAGAIGVLGKMLATGATADSAALKGINLGKGMGVYGRNATNVSSAYGVYGEGRYGVVGKSLFAGASSGVYGTSATGFAGVEGHSASGSGNGVFGDNSAGGTGVYGSSTSGRGVWGKSNSFQGVYGYSSQNAGVVGESLNFDGVYAVTNSSTHAAISAHSEVWGGWGVWASGGDLANGTDAIFGTSAKSIGVHGESSSPDAAGVLGRDDTGIGIAGRSAHGSALVGDTEDGWAMNSQGNATQAPGMSGFVKAMARINPFDSGGDFIKECFNSQRPAAQATQDNCGFNFVRRATGQYRIDFGFKADNRFVSVTPFESSTGDLSAELCRSAECTLFTISPTQWVVHTVYTSVNDFDNRAKEADAQFFIFVF